MRHRHWLLQATVSCVLLGAAPAFASDSSARGDLQPAVSLQAQAGLVSDYRFRGVSLSANHVAAQGGLELSTDLAVVGAWTSTIAKTAGGSHQEVDFYATLNKQIGKAELSATALIYFYPGDGDADYVELGLGISRALGPGEVTFGVNFAPKQKNLGHADNFYASLGGKLPTAVADISASIGHERGAFAPAGKWDWSVAASHTLGPIELSLAYVDSDRNYRILDRRNISGATIVARFMLTFSTP